jgi:DNA-directed RNA polymerase I subunit RPA1
VVGKIGGVGTGGIDVFLPVEGKEKEGGADEDGDVEMED